MDDTCAVCADTLEWVAYGTCGHQDVCSMCVVRLRFICNDRRCSICKTESDVIFITKALGNYTMKINDFSVFPNEAKEGCAGSYWYHEDTQAFFDDDDHYRTIKAMCRLSCNACDKMEDQFNNVEQLKGHLFHRHGLGMCNLCLEGRKAFMCEQKLYTRAQLNRHINTGDSEVDGNECERGGFMGHPNCELCKIPFYGESELYSHMSREHYTCHICQRQHPGVRSKYYKNYDDLEIHFRGYHYLCEDDACLAKKFTVFQSFTELKRHNTNEHGGRMSRPHRTAASQMPTRFQYCQINEDNCHGRGRMHRHQRPHNDHQLSRAIEASLRTNNVHSASSTTDVVSSSARAWQATGHRPMQRSSSSSQVNKAKNVAIVAESSYASSSHALAYTQSTTTRASHVSRASGSLVSSCSLSGIRHSSSAPNLGSGGYSESEPLASDLPRASATQRRKQSSRSRVLRIVEEVQTNNKSLIQKNMSSRVDHE